MLLNSYFLHAVTPLHAGTGQGIRDIDMPIIRETSTQLPFLPGSSVRGVLRAASAPEDREAVFGPEHDNAHAHAGAVSVSDARLLLFPVRSVMTTFAYLTSPYLLARYRRDATLLERGQDCPTIPDVGGAAMVTSDSGLLSPGTSRVLLEDWELDCASDGRVDAWADHLTDAVFDDEWRPFLRARLAVVPDALLTQLALTSTDVQARIRLDPQRKTVQEGALWYEESLPAESVLFGLIAAEASRKPGADLDPAQVIARAVGDATGRALQFGGKASTGRGLCRLVVRP
ncbi:type III-B CRISPR module RAMP protein Cmr4 [Deinococcus marmoris]|uniref:type III-B CRISPR module RAMP protein Cmr4 n=1 Tax=Deinococcus marmoris TaxID=249408 RepID=UPI0004953189|nr:type III-B CRISPR module RAMP protein Cmr4 [Deinococcus marmoris]